MSHPFLAPGGCSLFARQREVEEMSEQSLRGLQDIREEGTTFPLLLEQAMRSTHYSR